MGEAPATLTMPGYLPRIVDAEVESALRRRGAVLIEGTRGCGKTWTARRFALSEVRLDSEATLLLAASDPEAVLRGPTPRLLDEWQNAPQLWNRVRRHCDDRPGHGHFILTGTATPQDDLTRHTGTGRISRVLLRTLSLWEMGRSSGSVSIRGLFEGEGASCLPDETRGLREIAALICTGGWPQNLQQDENDALESLGDYVNEVVRLDVPAANGVRSNPGAVQRLMLSVAHSISTEAKMTKLASDMSTDTMPSRNTVAAYLEALRRIFVVEDQPAWSVNLNSRATLRKESKRHFVDPSLAAAMLRATPDRLLANHVVFGQLFESLTVRDLRIYGGADRGSVYHYRDNTGLEADAIIERTDGSWIAVEVKLNSGGASVDKAARSLLRLRDKVAPRRRDELAALLVVTSTGAAYRRPDGVQVAPITTLAP
ncbi:MAG: DUF4143 domain-containing protein [bacterium]|nr:DUF4143 domain-containing protein [bacterium]